MVAATAPAWQTQDGVRYAVVPPHLAAVVIARPDGDFHMLSSAQALGQAPAGALAVIDGSMFRAVGAQNSGEADTAYYRRVDRGMTNYRLLDTAAEINVASRRPRDGLTISVKPDGAVSVDSGDAVASGAAFAVQLYPPLVRNGSVVASNGGSNAQANWRAGIGVMPDGRIMFAVGRKDMVAFARAMLTAGARDAGYTDGGGSGRIALVGGDTYGSTENRPVPVWIAALPLAPGMTPRPAGNGGGSTESTAAKIARAGAAVAAVVAAALGLRALQKRKR